MTFFLIALLGRKADISISCSRQLALQMSTWISEKSMDRTHKDPHCTPTKEWSKKLGRGYGDNFSVQGFKHAHTYMQLCCNTEAILSQNHQATAKIQSKFLNGSIIKGLNNKSAKRV